MASSPLDVVFRGSYWTAGMASPVTGAVAVAGEVMIAVAHTPAAIDELTSSAGEVIDVGEGLLLPGFQDAHVHPVMAGVHMQECTLHALDTAEQFLDEIARYASTHPDRPWVTGAGWTFAAFPDGGPRREVLASICRDRPAALVVRDEHAVWVNTAALDLAGITSATPDPVGGRIERDRSGAPTGVLHEAAMALLEGVKPTPTPSDLDTALIAAQRTLHAHGVTGWQDALVGSFGDIADVYDTYRRAAAEGRLTARVNGALFYDPALGTGQIPGMVAKREAASGLFTTRTVKIMQDGIPENHTAAMHAPYLDVTGLPTDIVGDSLIAPDVLLEVVDELQAAGFDMHFHTMGDRALTEVLDALETASQSKLFRHQIAHLQSVRPDDIPRFAPLNVTANIQALWAAHGQQMDHLCIPLIGAERADQQFPFADLTRAGARLSAGSDWPVSDPSPINAIHVAVNRVAPGCGPDAPVFIERQRLSLAEALTAYTAGGAYVNRWDRTGSISPGMLADLTILDRDPFATPPLDLHTISPVSTYVGGSRVWTAPEH
ncbi:MULTISPECIES: amidohydrolase [unclassified Microbacterium]|uniref:amidohydrolase n=1 Tax=unclassified Microbacterium TaxID=2609290 RepID=UPI000EA9BE30|nr:MULTISPECIES: amidohydrolase [unclassified Microbacterium]MBT2483559.1 amidohydrolase [Microbacterium sp. ISL-108]RKN66571.1 amidohydrolase [Microbacterium sp. CGR2]